MTDINITNPDSYSDHEMIQLVYVRGPADSIAYDLAMRLDRRLHDDSEEVHDLQVRCDEAEERADEAEADLDIVRSERDKLQQKLDFIAADEQE